LDAFDGEGGVVVAGESEDAVTVGGEGGVLGAVGVKAERVPCVSKPSSSTMTRCWGQW
jgi:hypothetical protein